MRTFVIRTFLVAPYPGPRVPPSADGSHLDGIRGGTSLFLQARAELELWGSSPDEPEPMINTIKPASSPSLSFIKTGNFKLEPSPSFLKNQARRASSQGLIYCEPKIRPGPRLVPPIDGIKQQKETADIRSSKYKLSWIIGDVESKKDVISSYIIPKAYLWLVTLNYNWPQTSTNYWNLWIDFY